MSKSISAEIGQPYWNVILRGLYAVPLYLILLFLSALAESMEWLPQGREVVCTVVCLFLAAFIAGTIGARHGKSKRIIYALRGEIGLGVFQLILGLLTKDSDFFNILLFYVFLTLLSGALLGCMLGTKGKKHGKSKRKYNK